MRITFLILLVCFLSGCSGLSGSAGLSGTAVPGQGFGEFKLGTSTIADFEKTVGTYYDGRARADEGIKAVAEIRVNNPKGVTFFFLGEVDSQFALIDGLKPAFKRFRTLTTGELLKVEIETDKLATHQGLKVGDSVDDMIAKHGDPWKVWPGRLKTTYYYQQGMSVEFSPNKDTKVLQVRSIVVESEYEEGYLEFDTKPYRG